MSAFAYIVAAFCALWFVQAAVIHRNLSHIADLAKLDPPAPERWPSVSVVMAARNEGAGIARSLASRLGDGYPSLEVVPVDDRSEDDTPGIIAEYAARDPRVRPVRLDELPDGWLGKVHALAITPKSIRLRKKVLDPKKRPRRWQEIRASQATTSTTRTPQFNLYRADASRAYPVECAGSGEGLDGHLRQPPPA